MDALGDEYETVEIQFMGGEPLLEFPLIKECAEWLWSTPITDKQMMLFAPTNGTLLTTEMKEWFAKNKDRIHLGLSFDGDMAMQMPIVHHHSIMLIWISSSILGQTKA